MQYRLSEGNGECYYYLGKFGSTKRCYQSLVARKNLLQQHFIGLS